MAQDKRYARGVEDMQELIVRVLEAQIRLYPEQEPLIQGLANVVRSFAPDGTRFAIKKDDAWMRKVAEREAERQRAASCERSKAYYQRQKRKAAGEDVPPVKRGPERKEQS